MLFTSKEDHCIADLLYRAHPGAGAPGAARTVRSAA
jgi:formyltetrahydrofolate hydrolase